MLSIFIGIQDYRAAVKQDEAAQQLNEQEMREQSSWRAISSRVYRRPAAMQIPVSGVNNDIGRLALVNSMESIKRRNSSYSDDPIVAVFRFIDFVFVKLNEDLRNRKAQQERLGFALSRFSPASACQLAAMHLAGTDVTLKTREEDAMQNYRNTFTAFTDGQIFTKNLNQTCGALS